MQKIDLQRHLNKTKNCRYYRIEKEGDRYLCIHCQKTYAHSKSLYRHLQKCQALFDQVKQDKADFLAEAQEQKLLWEEQLRRAKQGKTKLDVEAQHLDRSAMQSEIHHMDNSNNNTNNQNIQQLTINNNINLPQLRAFGKEDISYITEEMVAAISSRGMKAVPELIRLLHYNQDHPQNHNSYFEKKNSTQALVYDGVAWELEDKDPAIERMIEHVMPLLYQRYHKMTSKSPGYHGLTRAIEAYENGDFKTLAQLIFSTAITNSFMVSQRHEEWKEEVISKMKQIPLQMT